MRNFERNRLTARLHWLDYGPRRYDPATTFWTSPDPLSAARPDISPYAYCAANPAANTDPSGLTVTIGDFQYFIGLNYMGNDEFTTGIVLALNFIAEWGGEKVIRELVDSKTNFNFMKLPDNESSYIVPNAGDNDYTIAISQKEGASFIGSVAHEAFHGVQFLNGQGGACVYNEVEAFVFASIISEQSFKSSTPFLYNCPVLQNPWGDIFYNSFHCCPLKMDVVKN